MYTEFWPVMSGIFVRLILPFLVLFIIAAPFIHYAEHRDDRLIAFFKKVWRNGDKVEMYFRRSHLAVYVVTPAGKELLFNGKLSKRDKRHLLEIGYFKSGRSFVVEGYEEVFNY